ncbi:MAG: HD domain-containing protein [Clostridia bacterium]|nr:HD domain-containing protein [Clostridia bacterium]
MKPEMNIKEKAMLFACFAHLGQVRKSEKSKPMIIHPIYVGRILEEYGFDEEVVAAGYLHDVIEDTKYTKEDILEMFGEDICELVLAASEPDKSKPWEERKLDTIRRVRGMDERKKAVICADKISNLESLKNLFERTGKRDFSAFNQGEAMQSWYYTVVHRSLTLEIEEEKNEMYDRLKKLVGEVFYSKMSDEEMEATLYMEDSSRLIRLKKMKATLEDITHFRSLKITENKPFVIEFLGTMRSGKSSGIYALFELLKKAGFSTKIIDEYTTSKEFKEELRPKYEGFTKELHEEILKNVALKIEEAKKEGYDFILIDRGLNDRLIWLYRLYAIQEKIDIEEYQEILKNWQEVATNLTDLVVRYSIKAETAMKSLKFQSKFYPMLKG